MNGEELRSMQREQTRLRGALAIVLIATICAFALFLSWLATENPLQPLLSVKAAVTGLLIVYAISAGVVAIYARWIRARREPVLRALLQQRKDRT